MLDLPIHFQPPCFFHQHTLYYTHVSQKYTRLYKRTMITVLYFTYNTLTFLCYSYWLYLSFTLSLMQAAYLTRMFTKPSLCTLVHFHTFVSLSPLETSLQVGIFFSFLNPALTFSFFLTDKYACSILQTWTGKLFSKGIVLHMWISSLKGQFLDCPTVCGRCPFYPADQIS